MSIINNTVSEIFSRIPKTTIPETVKTIVDDIIVEVNKLQNIEINTDITLDETTTFKIMSIQPIKINIKNISDTIVDGDILELDITLIGIVSIKCKAENSGYIAYTYNTDESNYTTPV